jgi:hypothetical protein
LLQEITTRDETGAPCTRGMRTTPFGQYVADGPPTSLSGAHTIVVAHAQPRGGGLVRPAVWGAAARQGGCSMRHPIALPCPPGTSCHMPPAVIPSSPFSIIMPSSLPAVSPAPCPADKGVDRVVSAQGALTRDTTFLVNGAQVGARDIITVSLTPLAACWHAAAAAAAASCRLLPFVHCIACLAGGPLVHVAISRVDTLHLSASAALVCTCLHCICPVANEENISVV